MTGTGCNCNRNRDICFLDGRVDDGHLHDYLDVARNRW